MDVTAFLDRLVIWARRVPELLAVAVVGSWARGTATDRSDVDLVLVVGNPDPWLASMRWLGELGPFDHMADEDWGLVQSRRVLSTEGLEIEFGLTTPQWATPPIDAGTSSVIRDGMRILYDPTGLLALAAQAVVTDDTGQGAAKPAQLLHASDRGDLDVLEPREFWLVAGRSGRVRPGNQPPAEADRLLLVYADTPAKLPFYYLPRQTPRLWLTHAISGTSIDLDGLDIVVNDDYRALIIAVGHRRAVETHQFYRYVLDPVGFHQMPHGEWVSFQPVRPIHVEGPLRTTTELAREGVQLCFVDDLAEQVTRLEQRDIAFHAEKLSSLRRT